MALAVALAACSTPALQPAVEVPQTFAAADAAVVADPEVAWWESYGDPVLSELIRRAAYENRDVRIAAERVRAARAGVTVSSSFLWPSVDLGVRGSNQSTQYGNPERQMHPLAADSGAVDAGVGVSWELDLSGRLRAGARAAEADALAAAHGVRGVRLLVLSDLASNYFILTGAMRQLDAVRAISAAHDETLRLVTARFRAGLATPFDVERAQTEASRARAAIPPLETVATVARHRIAVLIGDQAFNAGRLAPWSGETTVPTARSGQPADLLQRRPDLLAAQAQLDAANARRQQAHAEWFPRLFLGAFYGGEQLRVNDFSLGAARFGNVAGLLAMPLFNAGRTQAINEVAAAGQSEAVLRYEDAIVRALEDVENALSAVRNQRQQDETLANASKSAEAALGRAQSLYDRGQIDLLPLLDAQRTRLAVQISSNDSHTQLLLYSVQLYKALGGGWQLFEPDTAQTSAPPSPNS